MKLLIGKRRLTLSRLSLLILSISLFICPASSTAADSTEVTDGDKLSVTECQDHGFDAATLKCSTCNLLEEKVKIPSLSQKLLLDVAPRMKKKEVHLVQGRRKRYVRELRYTWIDGICRRTTLK